MTNYYSKFWDRKAEGYAKSPVANEDAYQQKLKATQQYLQPAMNVLEFGCGTGSTALVHAPFVAQYHAIDVSPNMIAIAKGKLAQTSIENLQFSTAALEDYPVDDESLDAVLGLSILHLMNDWQAIIQRVYNMLKPGGFFISNTACLGDQMRYTRFIVPIGRSIGLMPDVKIFTRQELEDYIERAGFRIDYKFIPENDKITDFLIAQKPG